MIIVRASIYAIYLWVDNAAGGPNTTVLTTGQYLYLNLHAPKLIGHSKRTLLQRVLSFIKDSIIKEINQRIRNTELLRS